MAFSRVAQVAADLDRIVQRLDNSRTQPDQAWALNPAWAGPDHDVTGNNARTRPPWRRRGTLARPLDRSTVDKTSRSTTRTRSGRNTKCTDRLCRPAQAAARARRCVALAWWPGEGATVTDSAAPGGQWYWDQAGAGRIRWAASRIFKADGAETGQMYSISEVVARSAHGRAWGAFAFRG